MPFDYSRDYSVLDFRLHPELYQIGVGEQGVLSVEPYKSEILPHWRFRTPEIARESADAIYAMFLNYRDAGDFVGMDMARKFLQMGFTRSRRYANHRSGRKWTDGRHAILPDEPDEEKAECARIFYERYAAARDEPTYKEEKRLHQERYGR